MDTAVGSIPGSAVELRLPVAGLPAAVERRWRRRLASCYRGRRSPLLRWLPAGYQRLSGPLRLRLFGFLGGTGESGGEEAPELDRTLESGAVPARPWSPERRFAVCLSHDVDTVEGVAGARRIAALERDLGLRSVFYVPASVLETEAESFARLAEDGFEVGLHGLAHGLAEADRPAAWLVERLDAALERFAGLGLESYRAPGFATSEGLHRVLADRFRSDSSVTVAPLRTRLQEAPGTGTRWPFRRGALVTLPASGIPDDTARLRGGLVGVGASRRREIETTARLGALLVSVDHTEAHLTGGDLFEAYRELAGELAARTDAWVALPRELARVGPWALEDRSGSGSPLPEDSQ